ncbi:hypothetical protein E2986_12955 [Frieseomelitta varia]|uniref:Uncharacterized protein n=1 Tax=Frieseomelitta varia TaxID=561572 RepID=A0A833RYA2_9HYME|nr:hypothetical protein E2986_12955 [Frieseomelitta varia]
MTRINSLWHATRNPARKLARAAMDSDSHNGLCHFIDKSLSSTVQSASNKIIVLYTGYILGVQREFCCSLQYRLSEFFCWKMAMAIILKSITMCDSKEHSSNKMYCINIRKGNSAVQAFLSTYLTDVKQCTLRDLNDCKSLCTSL